MRSTEQTQDSLSTSKALTHGLEILQLLTNSPAPLTATEIAGRVELHPSSVSRILHILAQAGYVRKPSYHSFSADYGIVTLAGRALMNFPLVTKPRKALQELAQASGGLRVSLATLWQSQIIYLLHLQRDQDPLTFAVAGYPLHLSSAGLRLLLERPRREALEVLRESRARNGWERPTVRVPETEGACLEAARKLVRHDGLVLDGWQGAQRLSAAIPIEVEGQERLALALSGPSGAVPPSDVLLLLQQGRRAVEAALS